MALTIFDKSKKLGDSRNDKIIVKSKKDKIYARLPIVSEIIHNNDVKTTYYFLFETMIGKIHDKKVWLMTQYSCKQHDLKIYCLNQTPQMLQIQNH